MRGGSSVRAAATVSSVILVALAVPARGQEQEQEPPPILWERTIPFEPLEPQFPGCGRMELIVGNTWWNPFPTVDATSDGGYLVAGEYYERRSGTSPDLCNVSWHYAFVRKYDADWSVLWTRYVAESDLEKIGSASPTTDGGAVLAGSTYKPDYSEWAHFIARYDARGEQEWFSVLTPFVRREVRLVTPPIETSNGGFVWCALETAVGGDFRDGTWWLLRADRAGGLLWRERLEGNPGEIRHMRIGVRELSDGGVLLFYAPRHEDGSYGRVLARTDSSGQSVWSRELTEVASCTETIAGEPLWFRGSRGLFHVDAEGEPVCLVLDRPEVLTATRDGGALTGVLTTSVDRYDRIGRRLWRWSNRLRGVRDPADAQGWIQEADGGFLRVKITANSHVIPQTAEIELIKLAPEEPLAPRFLRGDCDGNGQVGGQVTDAVFLLNYNFGTTPRRPGCLAACDANGDGVTEGQVTDAVYLLAYSFLGGPPPVAPFPDCGPGLLPGDERLGCDSSPACE